MQLIIGILRMLTSYDHMCGIIKGLAGTVGMGIMLHN